jgi:hypothetical protein
LKNVFELEKGMLGGKLGGNVGEKFMEVEVEVANKGFDFSTDQTNIDRDDMEKVVVNVVVLEVVDDGSDSFFKDLFDFAGNAG